MQSDLTHILQRFTPQSDISSMSQHEAQWSKKKREDNTYMKKHQRLSDTLEEVEGMEAGVNLVT